MLPDCLAALRACAMNAPEFPTLRQSVYDHFLPLVTDQFEKYHKRRIATRRRRRPRQHGEGDRLSDIADEIDGDCTDVKQAMFCGLAVAIDRLRVMPTIDLPDFVDVYLIDEIRSQASEFYAGDSSHILPKASTNSGRRKRGKIEHEKLTCLGTDDESAPALESVPGFTTTIKGERGSGEYLPSRIVEQMHNVRGFSPVSDLIEEIADSDIERQILQMLLDGYTDTDIMKKLNLGQHAFTAVRDLFRARATKIMGHKLPAFRKAS